MNPQKQAAMLRMIADELDPPTAPDPEPFLVRVTLVRDGSHTRVEDVPMPKVGDGIFNHFSHTGKRLHNLEGVPTRDEHYSITVRRISGEAS